MNKYIKETKKYGEDDVFFFAEKIVFTEQGGWSIYVNSDNCLVGKSPYNPGMPTIDELRSGQVLKSLERGKTVYEGRILFSGGVFPVLRGGYALLEKDGGAPYDKFKWTAPAGRADRDPILASVKEFYEETLFFLKPSQQAVFIEIAHNPYSKESEKTYKETLDRNDICNPENEFVRVCATPIKSRFLHRVTTHFEEKIYSCESFDFFCYFDQDNSTLEMLLPISIDIPEDQFELNFSDGEYGRRTRVFRPAELMSTPDDKLVPTMIELKKSVSLLFEM